MAQTILQDKCIGCGSCEIECPYNLISNEDGQFKIKEDECIDCEGFPCREICCTDAIVNVDVK